MRQEPLKVPKKNKLKKKLLLPMMNPPRPKSWRKPCL